MNTLLALQKEEMKGIKTFKTLMIKDAGNSIARKNLSRKTAKLQEVKAKVFTTEGTENTERY